MAWHLFLLVLGALLPLLGFAGLATWRYAEAERGRTETAAANSAREIAAGLDIYLAEMIATARVLAGSEALMAGDLAAFHLRAVEAARLSRGVVSVRDASSRQLLNSAIAWGAALPDRSSLVAADAAAARTRGPVVSDGFAGLVDHSFQFAVVLPLSPREGPARFLSVSTSAAQVQQVLEGVVTLQPGVVSGVMDRAGNFLARSPEPERWIGRSAGLLRGPAARGPGSAAEGPDAAGVPDRLFTQRSPVSGWDAVVWVPGALLRAPMLAAARQTALLGAGALALALLVAWLGARRIGGAVAALTTAAAALERDGTVPPLATPVREANRVGKALAAAALERQGREADLRRSEARLREMAERVDLALAAGAIIGTWNWELPADHFTADERFARSFGLDPERCRAGLGIEEVVAGVHPDDIGRLREAIAEAIARGGSYSCQYRVRQWDGAYRWLEANGRVYLAADGTPRRFPGVLLDIEERRALAAERDRAAALLRAFADAVPGVVYAKDREGRMLVANRGTTALIGKPPEFYLGRTDLEFLDDKAQAEVVMANDRRVMESGTAEVIEEAVSRPDGTPAIWLSTKAPFRDAEGRVIGIIGASLDITLRKEAEAVLARGKEELERLVEDRTRDLREAQTRLAHAQRMEALGQLAGGIAHDFNNVLQAVSGAARLIEARPEDVGRVQRLAAMAAEAAARGSSITRRLLAFSRRADLRAEPIEASELLRGTAEVLSHTLGAGIAVRVGAPPGLPLLFADKGQLETVLINLATNARDAMAGRGRIDLAVEAAAVGAGDPAGPPGLLSGDYLRLSVTDTGTGMPPEVLARATEPFFTTKESGKGTGLGLAMARGFAEQSGGALEIRSAAGQGTTVSVWLPVLTEAPALPPPLPARERSGGRAHVLLVDDEAAVREVTAESLRDAGFTVTAVAGAAEALALLDDGEPLDLLVSDLSMPGMDGLALIREAQRRRPRLPAILLTGFATDAAEIAVGGALSGAFSLLRKPIEGQALAERLDALLEGARAEAPRFG
ncbi:hybrid sensor histidine kinase/response regulator [Paracraurococcus lichenis]|uniref:histidine kinase n=1 Tax=Paracraurococcus lichenis TaxID=3064888 RepID=A0ABT9E3Y8_9PROT|nr:PAS domain-containing protein [Paracraurococcus sp. LOR1-02]MDO9710878.1 PAS domain-containing protein [Paracraurococcus sp. LOR1-02]